MKKIKIRQKKTTLVVGLFLLLTAALFEYILIDSFKEDGTDGIIAMVLLSVFVVAVMVIGGGIAIYNYFKSGKRLKEKLAAYGEENVLNNIRCNTRHIYRNPFTGASVYFTDKLIIDEGQAIIDYNEISMMYKSVVRSKYGNQVYLAFDLLDGSGYMLCAHIEDAEIMQVMQLCYQHNSHILLGKNAENSAKHKGNVERYQLGLLYVPKVVFENNPNQTPCKNADDMVFAEGGTYSPMSQSNFKYMAEEYVRKNYTIEQKLEAIKYYREATGVGLAEAKHAVEAIYAERYQNGQVLVTPREWTKEGRKETTRRNLKIVGIVVIIYGLVFSAVSYWAVNTQIRKETKEATRAELNELEEEGYREFWVVGKALERIEGYDREEGGYFYSTLAQDLFVYELEDGSYLGILAEENFYPVNTKACSGMHIFYDGDVELERVDIEGENVRIKIIREEDVEEIFGVPSAQKQTEQTILIVMLVAIGGIMALIGFIMLWKSKKK